MHEDETPFSSPKVVEPKLAKRFKLRLWVFGVASAIAFVIAVYLGAKADSLAGVNKVVPAVQKRPALGVEASHDAWLRFVLKRGDSDRLGKCIAVFVCRWFNKR